MEAFLFINCRRGGDADYGTKTVVEWLSKSNKKIDYCLVENLQIQTF